MDLDPRDVAAVLFHLHKPPSASTQKPGDFPSLWSPITVGLEELCLAGQVYLRMRLSADEIW